MRRIVGLQAELIITTALLVGAALLFGGFLLLRLTEQKLVEQQIVQVRSTVHLIGQALSPGDPSEISVSQSKLRHLLTGADFDLDRWLIYDRQLQPVGADAQRDRMGRRSAVLARQARLQPGPQLLIDYPESWLPFAETSVGSIESAVALYDSSRTFSGVVWLQFSLADVQKQVAANRNLVLLYVGLYGLVLTAFGVIVLSRNVVRPVNRLREATALVAAGDLETRVAVDGPQEIADLGESFNRMTDALRKGRDELLRSERMASVGHLSAGMAHEIGNPLAAIIGYLEMLKVDVSDDAQRDLVCRSLDESARIDRLVRDLLDYAAPTDVVADPVDACGVVQATVESLQGQVAFDGYDISVDCHKSLSAVCINPHKLTQVLVNLISNARDASPAGSTIEVSALPEDAKLLISVHDQGEGVDTETRAQIFDPFFSTKQQGKGRGLGLTICHRIVNEAGGQIEVVSGPEGGSTFTVRLPTVDGTKL